MTPIPDRELAEARACIDRGDENRAVKHLDRARRGYVKQHDVAGLEHLFVLADVLDAANERTRDSRENLVYAIGQNIRAETRRAAQLSGGVGTTRTPTSRRRPRTPESRSRAA